jgi:WD40 repeat protein
MASSGKKYIEWKDNSIALKDKYTLELRGEEGNLLQTFQDTNKFKNAIFTPNEQYVLSWSKKEIKLWSPKSKLPLHVFKLDGTVYGVLISKDGKYLMAWNDNVVKLWDINSPKALHIFRNDRNIDKAYFMEDVKKILIVLRDGNIKIHSLFTALDAKLTAQDYLLKTEVETGTSLLPSGELKVLSRKEWREKQKKFQALFKKETEK